MEPKLTHTRHIDEKPLWVVDNIATNSEISGVFAGLEQSAFKRNEIARPDKEAFKHWAVNLTLEQTQTLPFFSRIIETVARLSGMQYRAYRSYVNYSSYGDMLFTHSDCLPNANEMTALMYIAPQWDLEWGGETLFYNQFDDCEFACTPKPGRLTIFHGAIKHVGRPPNKICNMPRYTLALKLEKVG